MDFEKLLKVEKTLIIFVIVGCLVVPLQTQECCEEYCYDLDTTSPFRPQYRNLGQRNSYDFLKGSDYQIYNMPGENKILKIIREHFLPIYKKCFYSLWNTLSDTFSVS